MMLEAALAHDAAEAILEKDKSADMIIGCDGGSIAVKNDNGTVTLGDGEDLRDCLRLNPLLDGKLAPLPHNNLKSILVWGNTIRVKHTHISTNIHLCPRNMIYTIYTYLL